MNHSDKLLELEDRLIDLEFAAFKERWNKEKPPATRKTATGTSARTTPKKDWTLHFHKKLDGTQEYMLRSASGVLTKLPEDRKLWPKDVREVNELFETFDKQRRVGSRTVTAAGGSCEVR